MINMRLILFVSLFNLTSLVALSQVPTWQAPVLSDDTWRYLEPTLQPILTWNEVGFNDASWPTGQGGFGYADGDDNTIVGAQVSIYLRIEFNVSDPAAISDAFFYMDYDDGYVAYLNGTEIGRSATMNNTGTDPIYTTATDGEHEAQMYQGGSPEENIVSETLFQTGTNCLAIQVHNWSAASSDLSAIPFLFARITDGSTNYPNPPTWFAPPIEPFESNLPLVMLNTDGQTIPDNLIDATMGVIDNGAGQINANDDPPTDFNGRIGIEVRGSSSQQFPKKSYSLETRDLGGASWDVPLLGMPDESDWVLYAPYSDKSMMRNVLTYDLSNEMDQYASRTRYCEVFLNNNYMGVYVLMEKVKWGGDRVDIEKIDDNDNANDNLTGGYLLKVDKETGSGVEADWWSDITFYEVLREYGFQYDRPLRDNITPQQESYIQGHINGMEAIMDSPNAGDPATGYRDYFDLPALVDYTLLAELSRNIDGYRLSTYFSKQRDSRGGKLIMGPIWDINLGYGNADYCDGANTNGWAYLNCERDEIPIWWDVLFQEDDFQHLLACRWQELRAEILDETKLMDQMDDYATLIGEAADRNYQRWPILGTYVWPNAFVGATYAEEVQYMKDYISDRLAWMDANMPATSGSCGSANQSNILVSEISYHQISGNLSKDWIELYNSSSATIDLSHSTIKDGNNYNSFTIPAGTALSADSYLVVARDLEAFSAQYPGVTNVVQGSFNWGLSSGGDNIRIWDVNGLPIANFRYDSQAPWPSAANGFGPTAEFDISQSDQSDGNNWFEGCNGGSPGTAYVDCDLNVEELSSLSFNVRPSVGNGLIIVDLFVRGSETIQIELTDMGGRKVANLEPKNQLHSGRHQLNFNLADFGVENGFYLINVKGETGIRTERIVLAR
ncbi:MAG: hypothetical protein ACI85F_001487 [Bacteroidia bacterium]|jgi:hypothetical protein